MSITWNERLKFTVHVPENRLARFKWLEAKLKKQTPSILKSIVEY